MSNPHLVRVGTTAQSLSLWSGSLVYRLNDENDYDDDDNVDDDDEIKQKLIRQDETTKTKIYLKTQRQVGNKYTVHNKYSNRLESAGGSRVFAQVASRGVATGFHQGSWS